MSATLQVICVLLALIFFALATFGVPSHPKFSFIAAGLFFLTAALANIRIP
jgi:hypothetical protein